MRPPACVVESRDVGCREAPQIIMCKFEQLAKSAEGQKGRRTVSSYIVCMLVVISSENRLKSCRPKDSPCSFRLAYLRVFLNRVSLDGEACC